MEQYINKVILGDCLEVMKTFPDKSVDMILCDLPYGTTACSWDTIIPFGSLWKNYQRIIKDNGAIVLTASQPFTSALVMSNIENFKYEWIWDKKLSTGMLNANNRPMKRHESILIFSYGKPPYRPEMREGKMRQRGNGSKSEVYGKAKPKLSFSNQYYPTSLLEFSGSNQNAKHHPTAKPVPLFEYLIKTYTNEGELVLDNCAGSCTTAVAAKQLNRNFICIEKEAKYVVICKERLETMTKQLF